MHYAANAPRNIYSHTKSFTVTAVGLAMEEGKLSLEDHVAEVFKDKLPSNPDPNLVISDTDSFQRQIVAAGITMKFQKLLFQ